MTGRIPASAIAALAVITLLQVGISLLQQGPAAMAPLIVRELHISRAELGLLTSAIWGGMLLGTLPGGLLVDRYGERVVVGAGVFAMAVLVFVASYGPGFGTVFGFFLASSVGAAFASPGGTRALVAWFPRHRLGAALGVRQTGVTAGGLLGALALPPLALLGGWRVTFRLAAVVTVLCVALFVLAYREPAGEVRRGRPLKLRSLPGNRTWIAATLYGFVFMGALGVGISYLALYLHEGAGLSVVAAADLLALLQLGGLVGRLGGGLFSDRLGRRSPVMVAMGALAVLVALAFAFTGPRTPLPALALLSFLLGLSTLGWNALSITVISESVPLEAAATATGANLSIAFLAMFAVSPLFGLLADHLGGYSVSWLALAGWCLLGTLAGLSIRERSRVPAP
jgi:MFS family permease